MVTVLRYRIDCDGYYVRGRPRSKHRMDCPTEQKLVSHDLPKLTGQAVEAGWRLGRNNLDHCPECWRRTVREFDFKDAATPGRKR